MLQIGLLASLLSGRLPIPPVRNSGRVAVDFTLSGQSYSCGAAPGFHGIPYSYPCGYERPVACHNIGIENQAVKLYLVDIGGFTLIIAIYNSYFHSSF